MRKRFPPISDKLPVFMHGADYNPDQWQHDPHVLEEDIRLMKLAHCNVMSVAIFAWSALEPEEGRFDFGWLDRVLDRFAEEGIFAWLATPTGARPTWMSHQYPEVLRVGANRVRNLHGMRHNHCYSSPVYREKTAIMNAKLAERYAHHPAVVGWHISNELGGDCHCPYCQEAFRLWLQKKYGSLEALNLAWWTSFWSHTYTDWAQVESPAPHGERMVHGQNLDWKRFVTDQTIKFYMHELEPLRKVNPELPATANLMDLFEGLDYRKLAKVLDVVSWDAYPTWHQPPDELGQAVHFAFNHDLFRSLKHKPFMLMESTPSLTNWQAVSKLKKPGMHRLSSLQAVAHGSETVQYFQWRKSRGSSEKFHGAVVDHVGHEHTRVFRDVAELGETLEGLHEVLGTSTDAKVAIMFDWDNRWAVKDAQGPRNMGIHYENTVIQHYRAFWELGIPADIVGPEDDLTGYKLVAAPMLYLCTQETGEKLERFVRDGGMLASTYWSGIVDEHDLCHLGGFPGPLRKVLGIWAEEMDALYDGEQNGIVLQPSSAGVLPGLAEEYDSVQLCELVHAETAEVLGVYRDDFYAGRPALTVNKLGQGRAYYLATRAADPFYRDYYQALCREAGVEPLLPALPEGVSVQARSSETEEYLFVMNFNGTVRQVMLDQQTYRDVESGETLRGGSLELSAYGVRILARQVQGK
ncbi:beta-galactosidase [Paenibacillus mesotrionivorans]|uniref:Beta-galactosidase n=1 Tax=Paenibacillus mesotrionivorans TaxID=3160968 RepID=A0ACC7P6V4_9BACL